MTKKKVQRTRNINKPLKQTIEEGGDDGALGIKQYK